MRKLVIVNPDLSKTEKTFLDADYSTGVTITVLNNYGFSINDIAIFGEPGEEQSESSPVLSQSGHTTFTLTTALKFPHNKNDVIYKYEYDQYEISRYRSGTWTVISISNIQWDKRETIYIDSGGLSTDSYRYRLLNSISAATSDYSPTVAATGFTRSQVGYMINQVRKLLQDVNREIIKSDDEIIQQFNKAQDIIRSIREDWFFLRKSSNGQITTTANKREYALNTYLSSLNQIDVVNYRYNDGSQDITYPLINKTLFEMDRIYTDNNNTAVDDWPRYYAIEAPDGVDSTGYLLLDRKSKTTAYGSFYIRYYKIMTDLSGVADITDIPIPSILEDFALEYGFRIKGDDKRAQTYSERFYGPPPGRADQFSVPTGLRLLSIMQNSKGKAVGQPESLKKWRGRRPIDRMYGRPYVSNDLYREQYF